MSDITLEKLIKAKEILSKDDRIDFVLDNCKIEEIGDWVKFLDIKGICYIIPKEALKDLDK